MASQISVASFAESISQNNSRTSSPTNFAIINSDESMSNVFSMLDNEKDDDEEPTGNLSGDKSAEKQKEPFIETCNHLNLIQGVSGVGKSWLLSQVCASTEICHQKLFVCSGNSSHSTAAFSTIRQLLKQCFDADNSTETRQFQEPPAIAVDSVDFFQRQRSRDRKLSDDIEDKVRYWILSNVNDIVLEESYVMASIENLRTTTEPKQDVETSDHANIISNSEHGNIGLHESNQDSKPLSSGSGRSSFLLSSPQQSFLIRQVSKRNVDIPPSPQTDRTKNFSFTKEAIFRSTGNINATASEPSSAGFRDPSFINSSHTTIREVKRDLLTGSSFTRSGTFSNASSPEKSRPENSPIFHQFASHESMILNNGIKHDLHNKPRLYLISFIISM